MYLITQAQWNVISPAYQTQTTDGGLGVIELDEQGKVIVVPVTIVEMPPPPIVPEHYVGTWPLDPRD